MGFLDISSVVQGILGCTGLFVVASGLFLFKYQTSLIYPASFPPGSRTDVAKPSQFQMEDFEDIELITPDNVKLKAYWIKGRSAAALGGKDSINDSIRNRLRTERDDGLSDTTVLYLHANAGNMGHRLPIASALQRSIPSTPHIFMLSYRGYGHSEGSPSEKGLMVDAQTALDYILNHATLGKTKILLYGQSIGGAVAISLAFANQENQSVAGLIIENTFLSIPKLIPSVLPVLTPFTFLCHQIWPSEEYITHLRTLPILFLAGCKDELVPPEHMVRLRDLVVQARSDGAGKKRFNFGKEDLRMEEIRDVAAMAEKERGNGITWEEFANGTHNDTCVQTGYFDKVTRWYASEFGAQGIVLSEPN